MIKRPLPEMQKGRHLLVKLTLLIKFFFKHSDHMYSVNFELVFLPSFKLILWKQLTINIICLVNIQLCDGTLQIVSIMAVNFIEKVIYV